MPAGLSTAFCLKLLRQQLESEIDTYVDKNRRKRSSLRFLHFWSKSSCLLWSSCLIILVLSFMLTAAFSSENNGDPWLMVEAIVLIILLIMSICLECKEQNLADNEVVDGVRHIITTLSECSRLNIWNEFNYIDKNCPISPCVCLQWTIRDGVLVNLPCSLLVNGDIVLVRPGQTLHFGCQSCDDDAVTLRVGDTYAGTKAEDSIKQPTFLPPQEAHEFTVTETPITSSVRAVLTEGNQKHSSVVTEERIQVSHGVFERCVLPAFFCASLIVNAVKYAYWRSSGDWPELLLTSQVHTVLPLSMLWTPILFRILDNYGTAKEPGYENRKRNTSDNLRYFRRVCLGKSRALVRSTHLLHALGSITVASVLLYDVMTHYLSQSLCCVDKKGILSWPNPTPEKVCFLKKSDREPNEATQDCLFDTGKTEWLNSRMTVLDLTQDSKNSYSVEFDDPDWRRHLNSLKPLGLNILLNACNLNTSDAYTQFADHVTCASFRREESVPVVNRRCFCEIARQIGFSTKARSIFNVTQTLGVYRNLTLNDRSSNIARYKKPMPNIFSVLANETSSCGAQLMSQGTCDNVLDLCTEFWDGFDLCTLTEADRKKLLDFYHRMSISSYCTAFSYRPMTQLLNPELEKQYLLLPEDFCSQPLNTSNQSLYDVMDDPRHRKLSFHGSADSLLLGSSAECVQDAGQCSQAIGKQIFIGMVAMQYQAKQDIVQLIEDLEAAFIRFVHFSKENELRSRVFSEKMGLEAGWNCHISLREETLQSAMQVHDAPPRADAVVSGAARRTSRRLSAPGAIDGVQISMPPKAYVDSSIGEQDEMFAVVNETNQLVEQQEPLLSSSTSSVDSALDHVVSGATTPKSYTTDDFDSVTGALGLSNRAKLPRGIANIRPHIKNVDNVPLLVSLFTDCTPETTREMIKILQENGEVVCVLGSSANIDNVGIFLQADCSIAVEPVYPQLCVRRAPIQRPWVSNAPSPMDVGGMLVALPCSLSFKRDDQISLIAMIREARQHCQLIRKTFLLYIMFMLSLSVLMLLNNVVLLPAVLSAGHLLWLVLVVVPVLALGMMGSPPDQNIMNMALGKSKGTQSRQVLCEFAATFLLRLAPVVLLVTLTHGLTLATMRHALGQRTTDVVELYQPSWNHNVTALWNPGLLASQDLACLQLVISKVLISLCFVNRYQHLWRKSPLKNTFWFVSSVFLLGCQATYLAIKLSAAPELEASLSVRNVPTVSWILVFGGPFFLVPIQELVKKTEIKKSNRYQKRARLDFDTKLGMNSPF